MLSPAYSAAAAGTSPYFGWRCAATTIVTPLVLLGLSFVSDFQTSASDYRPALVIGLVYGLASAWCWTLTLIEGKISRFLIGLAIVTLLSVFAAATFDRPLVRYWVNMAGMILVQSVLFWLVRLPRWRTNGSAESASKQQFQILDILLVTTGLAALLTVARHYETPVAGDDYSAGDGWDLDMDAGAGSDGLLVDDGYTPDFACILVSGDVALALGGAFALAVLDQRLGNQEIRRMAVLYGVIALAYAVVWWTLVGQPIKTQSGRDEFGKKWLRQANNEVVTSLLLHFSP